MDRFDGTQIGLTDRYQFKAGNYDPVFNVHDKYAENSGQNSFNVPVPQKRKKGGKKRLHENHIDPSVMQYFFDVKSSSM